MEPDLVGLTLGSYRLTRFLARGGMGRVFEAEHIHLGSKVAVKVLNGEHTARSEAVVRFFNEARAASSVQHPGIVRVFDVGHHEAGAYLVMELLTGETLQDRLMDRERLTVPEALIIGRQIAAAVQAAHAAGIVHRDLKPENVFLADDPDSPEGVRAKILDFGVAKLVNREPGSVSATRTGQLLGTPLYMSPEQCNGATPVDARADIYALGCVVYDMLVGHPPFDFEGMGEIIAAHLYETPTPPSESVPEIPRRLEELILSMLAKRASDRPQTMGQVEVLLEASRHEPPRALVRMPTLEPPLPVLVEPPVRRWKRPLWALAAAALGTTIAFATMGAQPLEASVSAAPLRYGPPVALTAPAPIAEPPRQVRLRVESTPSGAEVRRESDGVILGQTPLELVVPAWQAPFAVTLRKRGFRTESVTLTAVTDAQVRIAFARAPKASHRVAMPAGSIKDGALNPFDR